MGRRWGVAMVMMRRTLRGLNQGMLKRALATTPPYISKREIQGGWVVGKEGWWRVGQHGGGRKRGDVKYTHEQLLVAMVTFYTSVHHRE